MDHVILILDDILSNLHIIIWYLSLYSLLRNIGLNS